MRHPGILNLRESLLKRIMNRMQKPIELENVRKVYFDTSAWNYVSKHADRPALVRRIKQSGAIVLANVISVGEILRTPEAELRRLMCSTMLELHGEGLLLERPEELAVASAEAFRRGEQDMLLPRTRPGAALHSYMCNPASPPKEDIEAWLHNRDSNLNCFIDEIRPNHPRYGDTVLHASGLPSQHFFSQEQSEKPVNARKAGSTVGFYGVRGFRPAISACRFWPRNWLIVQPTHGIGQTL
jgi:hypothetical protein